jgi:hypothetical protein
MATKKKTEEVEQITIKPPRRKIIDIEIRGTSPLVMHKWDEKAKEQMRRKHAGDKTKNRDVRDPEAECEAATYRLSDGRVGFPVTAFKGAMINAAHKDLGLPKTLVKSGLFIHSDEDDLVWVDTPTEKMREDVVRVGQGSTDLRYRPQFSEWRVKLRMEYDEDLLTANALVNLLNRAGFGVGVGEYRPEKGGDWGRFEVVGTEK